MKSDLHVILETFLGVGQDHDGRQHNISHSYVHELQSPTKTLT